MKKLVIIISLAVLTSCGSLIEPPKSNVEPPKSNTDYKNIIGNPVKIDKFEVAQYDFPKEMHWDDAKKICDSLGNDWRMPNKDELNILFQYKDRIGGFNGNWYWSSTLDTSFKFCHLKICPPKYLIPLSQPIVTTRLPGPNSFARASAATTFSPVEPPAKIPSSCASLRHI